MRKQLIMLLSVVVIFSFLACTKEEELIKTKDYSGTYIGYSWDGEDEGVSLDDTKEKIQTTLELDTDGIIVDAKILFWKKSDEHWYTRQDGTSRVAVDISKNPKAVSFDDEYKDGISMFTIDTHDMMSFFASKVEADGTARLIILEPATRYQYEIKMDSEYDYNIKIGNVTIDGSENGFIPTKRASSSGLIKLKSLDDLKGKNLFAVHENFYVMSERGVFKGIDGDSTMKQLLEATGINFVDSKPQESELIKGFHSNGGWAGNYKAIENYLIGKNATELTTLVDWSIEKWAKAINEDNFFGIDAVAGATNTAQNSVDGISGATVRMSRESTSYQRALVKAGILEEKDVIKGRF